MAVHRSLYQVLQIGSVATPEEIAAAHRARTLALESASTPADMAERSLVKDAFEILGDPARRSQYDEQLRERNVRALASGVTAPRVPREAPASASASAPWWRSYAAIGFVIVASIVGTWLYLDHQRKVEALRIEKERAAVEAKRQAEEIRLREQDAGVRQGTVDWAKDRFDKAYKYSTERQQELDRERQQRAWQYEQQRQAAQDDMVRRRAEDATRRAEYEQRRREQDSVRQAQQQLERDRRHLQELERNRGMKF